MSRYYNLTDQKRSGGERESKASNRIALPEFVPFNDKDSEVSPRKSQSDSNSTHNTPSKPLRRSPAYRNPDRLQRPEPHSSDRKYRNHETNGRRTPPREPYRSPHRKRSPSPLQRHSDRNRSRSPRSSHGEATTRREYHKRIEYHQSTERLSSERNRPGGASIFDRMSNPPIQRRKFNEAPGSRRSADSSSNGTSTQIVRSFSNHYDQAEPPYRSTELALELETHQRRRSPNQEQFRYVEQYMVESLPRVTVSSRSILLDENLELQELRNRIIAAETHCVGLEQTVLAYTREISKLRVIVNSLVDDYNLISSRR